MRGSFRDTPKIIFRMGRVKTIDEFVARSFNIHLSLRHFSAS